MGLMDWARPSRVPVLPPVVGVGDLAREDAHARLVAKLGAIGVSAPAVIDTLRATGQADVSGGQLLEVRVTITPNQGKPYKATIVQSFLPSQMEDLSPGRTIGVTYDPDDPIAVVISTW